MIDRVVKPYYSYKQEAYGKLRELAVRLLKESDYYIRSGNSEDIPITVGSNLKDWVNGTVNFYIKDQWVLSIVGTKVSGLASCRPRGSLTLLENKVLKNSIEKLFRHVSSTLGAPIVQWMVTEDYCKFISSNGTRYINKG